MGDGGREAAKGPYPNPVPTLVVQLHLVEVPSSPTFSPHSQRRILITPNFTFLRIAASLFS
jgi:hypothetical protein